MQRDGVVRVLRAQDPGRQRTVRGSVIAERPIVEPDPQGRGLRAGHAERLARIALRRFEASRVEIRDREMRRIDLVGPPVGDFGPGGRDARREREAKERQLEAEVLPAASVQLPGQVPPLVSKLAMRAEVGGKAERARLERLRETLALRTAAQDRKPATRKRAVGVLLRRGHRCALTAAHDRKAGHERLPSHREARIARARAAHSSRSAPAIPQRMLRQAG